MRPARDEDFVHGRADGGRIGHIEGEGRKVPAPFELGEVVAVAGSGEDPMPPPGRLERRGAPDAGGATRNEDHPRGGHGRMLPLPGMAASGSGSEGCLRRTTAERRKPAGARVRLFLVHALAMIPARDRSPARRRPAHPRDPGRAHGALRVFRPPVPEEDHAARLPLPAGCRRGGLRRPGELPARLPEPRQLPGRLDLRDVADADLHQLVQGSPEAAPPGALLSPGSAPRERERRGAAGARGQPRPLARAAGRRPGDPRAAEAQAMGALSPRQRSIFVMKHFEEMSIPEIAEVTGLDAGTIKSHLFRAAQKMRERLADFHT